MSAPEFKALFNSNLFKYWFNKGIGNKKFKYETFIHQTRGSSSKFIDNTNVDFILSKEKLDFLLGNNASSQIFSTLKSHSGIFAIDGVEYRVSDSGQEQILIKDLKFSTLNNTVARIIDSIGTTAGLPKGSVSSSLSNALKAKAIDRGHVFGFGNTLLMRTKEELAGLAELHNYKEITKEQLDGLNEFIDTLVDILEDYDISTSDIKDLDTNVFVKYRKTTSNWLIEWQTSEENSQSGRKVGNILGTTGTVKGARGVFTYKATEQVVNNFIQKFIDESITAPNSSKLNLLNQKTSPSMKDMVIDQLISSLTAKPQKLEKIYSGSFNLPKKLPITTVVNSSKVNRQIKQEKSELKKLKVSINKKASLINSLTVESVSSISNLEAILRMRLVPQVIKNMGTGTSRRILNYRTGRFAESAAIDHLSQSRAGMISVFYTYMKNPYATFSEGGRQQYPKTRDPKLLISKSIREIAAEQAVTRLRAVLV